MHFSPLYNCNPMNQVVKCHFFRKDACRCREARAHVQTRTRSFPFQSPADRLFCARSTRHRKRLNSASMIRLNVQKYRFLPPYNTKGCLLYYFPYHLSITCMLPLALLKSSSIQTTEVSIIKLGFRGENRQHNYSMARISFG